MSFEDQDVLYHAFKDWTLGCFLMRNVDKQLLFRVYNLIVSTWYYDIILLKIERLDLNLWRNRLPLVNSVS
jgi:hypothetical protein